MAYREAVEHLTPMDPATVAAIGQECLRAKAVISSVLPRLARLPGTVQWQSPTRDLYEQRLREAIDLAESLYHAFDKAGEAVLDYARAQQLAKAKAAQAAETEASLGLLIAPIAATQSTVLRLSAPLRQWTDLRSITGAADLIAELAQREAIAQVRERADALWQHAARCYEEATRIEAEARAEAVHRLRAAWHLLPDFSTNRILSETIASMAPQAGQPGKYRIGSPATPIMARDNGFTYDPQARPTLADQAQYKKWMLLMAGAQAAAPYLDDAIGAYAHYLGGTGTDWRVDYEEAYAEDRRIRAAVDSEILSAQQETERLIRESGQTAFQVTGNATQVEDLGGYPQTHNWQKALGGHYVYGTADVLVVGDQVTMTIVVHAEDIYNFNPGATDIATGLPAEENGRFAELGWAKEFRSFGELRRTVTWTLGDIAGTTAVGSADV